MPRYARLHAPGALVHVIARFVNRQYRLTGGDERAFYLAALARALLRTDWLLLAYALMSNHVHLALLAAREPAWQLLKPLHIAVARELNRRQGTFGPVFAERATTIVMPALRTGSLVGYVHNNPGRAGLVEHPADSPWTSHRAWVGIDPAPPWLAVGVGLRAAGFDSTDAGRLAFDQFVCDRRGEPRDRTHSRADLAAKRARVRALVGMPVEVSSPVLEEPDGVTHVIVSGDAGGGARPRWDGDVRMLLREVGARSGVSIDDICSRRRDARIVRARRLAGLVGVRGLGVSGVEMASALGISSSSLSELLGARERVAPLLEAAAEIAVGLARAPGGNDAAGR